MLKLRKLRISVFFIATKTEIANVFCNAFGESLPISPYDHSVFPSFLVISSVCLTFFFAKTRFMQLSKMRVEGYMKLFESWVSLIQEVRATWIFQSHVPKDPDKNLVKGGQWIVGSILVACLNKG